jgi:hypothetical protein
MTETVSSKFKLTLWLKFIVFTFVAFGAITVCIITCINNRGTYNWGQFLLFGLFSIALAYVYFGTADNSVISITVSGNGLHIKHLMSSKKVNIGYNEIKNISALHVNGKSKSKLSSSYLRLEMKLANGQDFSFTNNQFSNYDELKEAIERFRGEGDK